MDHGFDGLRLVADDADAVAGVADGTERGHGIGIEVVDPHLVGLACGLALRPLRREVEIRPEDPERRSMIAAGLDARADHREERQPRDPEPVGPLGPDPGLVDERLADIEDDRADRHLPDRGRGQDLSCQLVPPSGAPGSFWCFRPVRLSICSTPRR